MLVAALLVSKLVLYLLNLVYEDVFLTNSHGFRKGRGPISLSRKTFSKE